MGAVAAKLLVVVGQRVGAASHRQSWPRLLQNLFHSSKQTFDRVQSIILIFSYCVGTHKSIMLRLLPAIAMLVQLRALVLLSPPALAVLTDRRVQSVCCSYSSVFCIF